MRNALSIQVLCGLFTLTFAGCSGGGADATNSLRVRCAGGEAFCLISCDLGCSQIGCSVTEIAENQRLRFTFSDRLAVATVNAASVSIRTATGVAPEGDLEVDGSELSFVPRVRTVNGVSTFGFQRNEGYVITLAGGPSSPFGVSNVSGDRLTREFTCTVVASRGIVDPDQQPPRVEMIAPTNPNAAPLDPTVVLRFSALIATPPLRGTLTPSSPIRFTLRRAISTGGTLVCDRDAQGTVLEGIPRLSTERVGEQDVTVVTFKPTVQLPGESCVQVSVTADLRDLSGRQAVPATFEFFTEAGVSTPLLFAEGFASAANLNAEISSGTWGLGPAGPGAYPGTIGGDGRHGSFDPTVGITVSNTEYTWDTTLVTIPASKSLTGLEYIVQDGKFYFTDFRLAPGVTLNFIGPVPPQIYVRGKATVEGSIRLNGAAMTTFNGRGVTSGNAPYITGQSGGTPGAGGGRGGKGGDECQGTGPLGSNGSNGEDVKLLAGHAYLAQALDTGGRGSLMNPPTGIAAPNTPVLGTVYRAYFSPGGGGGGNWQAGGVAAVTMIQNLQVGAVAVGGLRFPVLPYPVSPPPGYSSLNHFLVGGSGGGGGGSHAFGTFTITGDTYIAGAGGSGGGGALALRAGSDLYVASTASLQSKGGAGVLIRGHNNVSTSNVDWGVTSPGGGGSGGSFLLQCGATLNMLGVIDTGGSSGSSTGQIFVVAYNVSSTAGAGAPGYYRLETLPPSAGGVLNLGSGANVPVYNPADNSGTLNDRDTYTGCTSTWRSSNLIFPPQWLHYELEVDTDGNGTTDVTYTDTGAPGTQVANNPNTDPVVVKFQGAQMAQSSTEPLPGTIGQWRDGIGAGAVPGIGLDSALGFRFMLTFNRGLFPNCVVKALRVHART